MTEQDLYFMNTSLRSDLTSGEVEQQYQLRKKLYENRELFVEETETSDVSEHVKDIAEIRKYVQKGRNILVSELEKYKDLTTKSIIADEFESVTKNTCYECQQKLSLIKSYFERNGEDIVDIQNTVDGAMFAIGEIIDLIDKTVGAKKTILMEEIKKNKAIIKAMADTYNIVKTTNIQHTCPICLTNEVDVFCDPCGHNYCAKCLKGTHYCYICRLKINKLHSLFFP